MSPPQEPWRPRTDWVVGVGPPQKTRRPVESLNQQLGHLSLKQSRGGSPGSPNKTQRKSLKTLLAENSGLFCSFTQEDLRSHPNYISLPPPDDISEIKMLADLSRFRENSMQWDLLHIGRLSNKTTTAALGLYEPEVSRQWNIPRFLVDSKKARMAFDRLVEEVPTGSSLEEANAKLISPKSEKEKIELYGTNMKLLKKLEKSHNFANLREIEETRKTVIWKTSQEDYFVCSCEAILPRSSQETCQRLEKIENVYVLKSLWGDIFEASGVLLAINHFKSSKVHEIGYLISDPLIEEKLSKDEVLKIEQQELLKTLQKLGVSLGSTPDGVIVHEDGSVEILEVKTHCPFLQIRGQEMLQHREVLDDLPIWYFPQVQLQMLCKGFNCNSAIISRLASKSAAIYRIKRDDEYIVMMLKRLASFHQEFVQTKTPPGENFWKNSLETKHIIWRLKIMHKKCILLKEIKNDQIQKHPHYSA